jgi:hypothetical protein
MNTRFATVLSVGMLLLIALQPVEANRKAMFKRISALSGAGCEQGSVAVAGENTETLSVLFSQYDAGRESRSGTLHTKCEFSLPISVPPGQRLSVLTAEWQGYVKGRGALSRVYSLTGPRQRPRRVSRYREPEGKNYLERDDMYPREINRNCHGGEINIRVKSNIIAANARSYIAVDTVDLQNQVVFRLHWTPCR